MIELFQDWPHAIRATRKVADACKFDLRELAYEYPKETVPEGRSAQEYLTELTWKGADWRYPEGLPEKTSCGSLCHGHPLPPPHGHSGGR